MNYTRSELIDAIEAAGISRGDVVSLQVSLGRIGIPVGVSKSMEAVSNFVIDAFLDVLGDKGTLIVPTYTYSIGRGDIFEVETTPSQIGEFTEVFRKRASVRSRDPMLSNAGIGWRSVQILCGLPHTCYGEWSTFHKLRKFDAKIVTLGVPLRYATFRHHIEEMANVPFRFIKKFTGVVREGGKDRTETWEYFAAPKVSNCEPNGETLARMAIDEGLVGTGSVGRGNIFSISATDYFDFGMHWLKSEPWLTAVGPSGPPFELFAHEPQWLARNFVR